MTFLAFELSVTNEEDDADAEDSDFDEAFRDFTQAAEHKAP